MNLYLPSVGVGTEVETFGPQLTPAGGTGGHWGEFGQLFVFSLPGGFSKQIVLATDAESAEDRAVWRNVAMADIILVITNPLPRLPNLNWTAPLDSSDTLHHPILCSKPRAHDNILLMVIDMSSATGCYATPSSQS